MTNKRLVLASGSPQRKELLEEASYRFDIVVPGEDVECGICSNDGPAALVQQLAERKAADVVQKLLQQDQASGETIVIACDTVAECEGFVLGKPRDEEHARTMLDRLRGTVHRVYSGLCVWPLGLSGGVPVTRLAITTLRMDDITDDDLEEYLASGLWRGKAGAFGLQDRPSWLHIVEGSSSNVIGLPMEMLAEMLEGFS